MRKTEYLSALAENLAGLPEAEREKTLAFYAESIDDRMEEGMREEEAVAALGKIDDIVREIGLPFPGQGKLKTVECSIPAAEIQRIEWSEENAAARVSLSPDDKIHIVFQCSEEEDDMLKVTTVMDHTLHMERSVPLLGIFWKVENYITEIQIPEDKSLELDLRAGNGSVRLQALRCSLVEIQSGNGAVTVKGLDCRMLHVKTGNGQIVLTDVHAEEACDAKAGNGSISLENVSAGSALRLHTTNGGIKGTAGGAMEDYTIRARAGNGSSNLPGDWGTGGCLLEASAGNGSVSLRFAEEAGTRADF